MKDDASDANAPPHPSQLSPRPSIEVAAGLVFRNGKLLITQRYLDSHQGGSWEFPGGKREPQETFQECLERELLEELGIKVEVRELVASIHHEYPEKTVLLKFFRCRWQQHEPQTLGCPAFRWVSPPELPEYQFPPADARLLELLKAKSNLWE